VEMLSSSFITSHVFARGVIYVVAKTEIFRGRGFPPPLPNSPLCRLAPGGPGGTLHLYLFGPPGAGRQRRFVGYRGRGGGKPPLQDNRPFPTKITPPNNLIPPKAREVSVFATKFRFWTVHPAPLPGRTDLFIHSWDRWEGGPPFSGA